MPTGQAADSGLERVLRQDRAAVLAAIAAVTVLAWANLRWLSTGMDMAGMAGAGMAAPGVLGPEIAPWGLGDVLFMLAMWIVMMVGMMMPTVAPMILVYARVGRHALARGRPFAATGWFAGGYLIAWTGFAILATAAQWALEQAALLSPMTMTTGRILGGTVLIGAGLYQWTPFKEACLAHCQAPLVFIQRHGGFRRRSWDSLGLGVRHGLYCIGCCWALMAILFAVGIMNALWIAAIALFVLIEKVAPAGRLVSRIAGTGLVAAGVWTLLPA